MAAQTPETTAAASSSSSSAYNPSTRPAQIDELISGVDRYNPHNLPLLQDYLDAQLKGEYEWDCMAAVAILKLYQFNPTTFSYDLVTLMLAKSLHALPSPHFNLCLSLLGEAPVSILPPAANEPQGDDAEQSTPATAPASSTSSQPSAGILTDPAIVKLHHLATLLSSSRYPTFWNALHSGEYRELREDVLDRLENFEDGVRRVALQGTASSFQSISRKRLASYLGLEDNAELDDYLKSAEAAQGWTVEGDMVKVPLNRDNHLNKAAAASTANPTVAATQQEVTLGDLNKLLQQAQPSTAGLRA